MSQLGGGPRLGAARFCSSVNWRRSRSTQQVGGRGEAGRLNEGHVCLLLEFFGDTSDTFRGETWNETFGAAEASKRGVCTADTFLLGETCCTPCSAAFGDPNSGNPIDTCCTSCSTAFGDLNIGNSTVDIGERVDTGDAPFSDGFGSIPRLGDFGDSNTCGTSSGNGGTDDDGTWF